MKYVRIDWKHEFPDEPVTFYSEIDDERWEVRAVVVYRDGRAAYASRDDEKGGADLGEDPIPELAELAKDPEFKPAEITKEEFEALWAKAVAGVAESLGRRAARAKASTTHTAASSKRSRRER